jgi:hypothetical protein
MKKILNEKSDLLFRKLVQHEFKKVYSQKLIIIVFFLIFYTNILINVDHGSLPGCSIQIKEDLDLNDFQFGVIGAVVFGGLTFGSIFATAIYSKSNWIKLTLVGSITMNGLALFAFTLTDDFYLDTFLRIVIGFF